MAKTEDAHSKMKITSAGGGGGCLGRTAMTLLLVVVIIGGAAFFAVRLAGAREMIRGRLERALGFPLTIGETRIGWPYDLVVRGIESKGFGQAATAGIRADELRIGASFDAGLRLRVYRPELIMVQDSKGDWAPSAFRPLGDLPAQTVASVSALTALFRKRWSVAITDGRVQWLRADGEEWASSSGIDFVVQPVVLPGESAWYHRLSAYTFVQAGTERVQDVSRTWLTSDERPYVELARRGGGDTVFGGGFWEPAR